MSAPWVSACDEPTQLDEMRAFAESLPDDLGPMFGRDVVRLIDRYTEVVAAAREFIGTTTVFRQRVVSRDAFTRLAVSVMAGALTPVEAGQRDAQARKVRAP